MDSFFEPVISKITSKTKELLERKEMKGTEIIMLVGGFGSSPMMTSAFKKQFQNYQISVANDPYFPFTNQKIC